MIHENELRAIAQRAALGEVKHHDYLPKTAKEAETFHVHRWVIDAMETAFRKGVEHAAQCARNAAVVNRDYGAKP